MRRPRSRTWAKDFGRGHGINYTDEQWTTLIEQAVNSFNRAWTPLAQPPATTPATAAPTATETAAAADAGTPAIHL